MLSVISEIPTNIHTESVHETARAISELGVLNVASAALIVIAFVVIGFVLSSFKKQNDRLQKTSDQLTTDLREMVNELLSETRKQNDMLNDISEGLRQETMLRITSLSNAFFDLAVEKVVQMVTRVKKENGIADRERTKNKIRLLLSNLHEERKGSFDNFSFRGKKVSEYTQPEWIDWVAEVVETEVYAPKPNQERTYTNVKAVYKKIRNDFEKHLKAVING